MATPRDKDFKIQAFSSQKKWEAWLAKNHSTSDGLWIRFYKKNSKTKTVVYAEALEVALCYGWIDSQAKSYDAESYLQKFTPRRSKSIWSKVNTEKVLRLIKEKKMRPAGLAAIEAAKADGRWERAYHSPSRMEVQPEFKKALERNKKAKAFFDLLNQSNRYAYLFRIHAAHKPEARAKKVKEFVAMLAAGKKFH